MINALGDDIRWIDRYRHKYDSAMAEWLDSGPEADESTGSVEWHGHVSRFGKRLLHSDDRGFVTVERFSTEAEAIERFNVIDDEYSAWMDEDDTAPEYEPTVEPDEPTGWVHAPARDGAGCSWCGAWAMVNADGMCQECHEADEPPFYVDSIGHAIIPATGHAVSMTVTYNGTADDSDRWTTDRWTVTLRYSGTGQSADFPYFQGLGHRVDDKPTAPTVTDVMSSLVLDYSTRVEMTDVAEYAENFGMPDDADDLRSLLVTWQALTSHVELMGRLFGADLETVIGIGWDES
jgi:hypothetical protein